MFRFLGHVVRRAWPFFLVGWGLFFLATWLAAPPWNEVAQDREFSFLPADAPSLRAGDAYAQAFPENKSASNVVLVLHRTDEASGSFAGDLKFIENVLEPGLRQIAESEGGLAYEIKPSEGDLSFSNGAEPGPSPRQPIVWRIRTPNAPGTGALLVSPDHKALLVVVELTTELTSHGNWPIIEKIEKLIDQLREGGKIPTGADIALTGSAAIGRDHSLATLQSVKATGLLTVLLVTGLLIFIYRAPILALIPLAAVYLAVQIALHLLALLAQAEAIVVFEGLQIYITILAYGAGVDYCLFLTARYKEELDAGARPADAVARAIGGVGTPLVASAATVMCGIGTMWFAEFGKFHEAGFAIPLSLFLVLLTTLTFSSALLCLAGRWAFWPQRLQGGRASAGKIQEAGPGAGPGWFSRGGALERVWEKIGALLVRRAGTVWLITVALMAPFAIAAALLYHNLSYDLIGDLPADAPSTVGTRVLQDHLPAGIVGPVTVLLVDPRADFRKEQGRAIVARLTDRLREQKQELGLADVRSLTAPLGITKAATQDFSGLDLPREEREKATRRAALEHYATDLGGRAKVGTRLELILDRSPFSRQSIEDLGRIEQAIRADLTEEMRESCRLDIVGTTASVRDLSIVMQRDRARIELLVLASVFVILVLLLRRFVLSLYLLLSVLFSYYTTLGVTFAVFWVVDPAGFSGIDWKVAIFLFTILIAVGEDYNIFLMTRVDEETIRHGPVRGVTEALDRTGPIITSCGIIMAGTFLSLLLAGSLIEMKQLGFALAFGVLLDTFVVRPILVPSFLIMQRTGRLSLKAATPKEARQRAGSVSDRSGSELFLSGR